jgi:hypothetical protein
MPSTTTGSDVAKPAERAGERFWPYGWWRIVDWKIGIGAAPATSPSSPPPTACS